MALPWERSAGEPEGEGICLSGGGLRSASFSLGVLQGLQEHRGLLYGPSAADYLSVVSGGSYVAATFMLTASALEDNSASAPLAPDAPETAHMLSHGRYLIEDGRGRTAWRFSWRLAANAAAGAMIFCWTAVILADLASVVRQVPMIPVWAEPWRKLSPAFFFVSVGLLAASALTDRARKQWVFSLAGLAGLVLTAPSTALAIRESPVLSAPSWWLHHWQLTVPILVAVVVAGVVSIVGGALIWRPPEPIRVLSDVICRNAPRLGGMLLTCLAIAAIDRWFAAFFADELSVDQMLWFGGFFFATLFGGALASFVPDVVSLHRPYRDLLSRCFAVRRRPDGSGVEGIWPPTTAPMSATRQRAGKTKVPRLLVVATANVRVRREARRRRSNVAPFIFSSDRSGLSGMPDASFSTERLELGRTRTGILRGRTEPELSLMDAVATTGAALAPSMGSRTMEGARPVWALLNFRLGVWLPNPLSPVRRALVEARPDRPPWWSSKRREYGKLGPGFEALLSEFFGLHEQDARRIFVTDGGHYDNLGLLALLRARCRIIWCVDAYHRRRRLGRQLERVVDLARVELSVEIDVDTSRFRLIPGSDHVAEHAVAVGTIAYPDTSEPGVLLVLKLALTPDTPVALRTFRERDRRFPYHSTGMQWLDNEQFEHYRQLGHYIASEAVATFTSEG